VIAADEGVMPQTREHLAICSLLGIPAGLVALTKADLVAPDLLELAMMETEELLAGTPFAGAPVLAVSARTGTGIPELEAALAELGGRWAIGETDPDRPARLPIDRAFHLKGLGVVVTGTLASGAVAPGDLLELLPGGCQARVRSVQVHGGARERAEAGERVSLQLTGVELGALARGMVLAKPGAYAATRRLAVRLTVLADAPEALSGWTPVRLHLYSARILGELRPLGRKTIEPGETAVAELRLGAPVVAARGDRFVLRRPSPQTTLGGGEVLDPAWHPPRATALPSAVAALGGERTEALALWIREAGEAGAGDAELARRLGLRPAAIVPALSALAAAGKLLEAPAGPGRDRRWIAPAVYRAVAERAGREVAAHFERDRLSPGMPKAEAVARVLPRSAAVLAPVYLGWLAAQGVLEVDGDLVHRAGRRASLSGEESDLARRIAERFAAAGLEPPSPGDLAAELGAKRPILDGVIRWLVDKGRLVKLPGGLMISAEAVEKLAADLLATGWDRFSIPELKDRFGLTRKWAIPLLEHLDSTGRTRRIGDQRQVVRR
jgi:selenocysteine-specific elongation factor